VVWCDPVDPVSLYVLHLQLLLSAVTCDARSERTAGNVRVSAELDHDQIVAGHGRRVGELLTVGHLAAFQLRLGRTVHRHRQSARTRLRSVHHELGRLVCRTARPVVIITKNYRN